MLAPGRNSEQPTQRNGEEYQPPAPPHQPPIHDSYYQPNTVNNPYCSPCPSFVEQWDHCRPLNQLPNVPPPSPGPFHMSPWTGAQTYHQSFPCYHQQPYPQQPQWPQLEQARWSEPRPKQPEVSHPQWPQPPQRASSPMAGSPPPKRRRRPNGGIRRDNVSGIAYVIERTVLPAEEYNKQLGNIRNKHSQRKSKQIQAAKAASLDNTQEILKPFYERMSVEIIGREEDDHASLNEDMARVAALSHGLQHEIRQGAAYLRQIKELKLEKDRLEEEIRAIEKKHEEGKRKEEAEFYSKYIKGNSNEEAMTSSIIRINSNLAGNEEENNNMEENIVNDDSDGTVEFETMAQELWRS